MAHDVDRMMYCGDTPWHGLGTKVNGPATALEAIKAAGLDWEAIKVPVYAKHSRGETLVPDTFAMMRSDRMTGADAVILGTVGSQYEPIQNKDAFGFFDPIVGKNAAVYHTAGSLGVGERVWILAKLPDDIKVAGKDITEKFLLLYNSHDGTGAAQVKFTPIRVVCQNTLNMALRGESPLIKIAHTRGVSAKMEEVHKAVEFINTTYKKIEDSFQQWAKLPVDEARLKRYVESVFPLKDITDQKRIKKIQQYRLEVSKLFKNGKGNTDDAVKGTLWAAYNGITEFADFELVAGTRTQSGRVARLWFGDASKVKELAYDTAAECAADWAKA